MYRNKSVQIIANDQGNRNTPLYVEFIAKGERLIGDTAKNQLPNAKRLIGIELSDHTVPADAKLNGNSKSLKKNRNHMYSAMVLTNMRETAAAYLKKCYTCCH